VFCATRQVELWKAALEDSEEMIVYAMSCVLFVPLDPISNPREGSKPLLSVCTRWLSMRLNAEKGENATKWSPTNHLTTFLPDSRDGAM
jgi:hypothetical protein